MTRPDPEVVDKVARAIGLYEFPSDDWELYHESAQQLYRELASAAIEASGLLSLQRERDALRAALSLWLAYDDQDEADFAQAGPVLLYARAIEATRAALTHVENEGK